MLVHSEQVASISLDTPKRKQMVVAMICPSINKTSSSHIATHLSESLMSSNSLINLPCLAPGNSPEQEKEEQYIQNLHSHVGVVTEELRTVLNYFSWWKRWCCQKAFGCLSYEGRLQGEVLLRRDGLLFLKREKVIFGHFAVSLGL